MDPCGLNSESAKALTNSSTRRSAAQIAAALVNQFGCGIVNKQGNTLLHLHVHSEPIYAYVLAHRGIPVNHQNTDGDTALHVATRCDARLYAQALIQCGASTALRNKLGQNVLDCAKGETQKFLKKFEPGLYTALMKGHQRPVERMIRLWCHYNPPNVKNGQSLLEVASPVAAEHKHVKDLVRRLQDNTVNSNLIHAVLSNNNATVQQILQSRLNWNVNLRFQDSKGRTMLQTAIEYHDLELVKILVTSGARRNVRVRTNEEEVENDITVPLLHVSLEPGVPFEIFEFLLMHREGKELRERDVNGDTVLLKVIRLGLVPRYIEAIISIDPQTLLDRTFDRLHARELALLLEHDRAVGAIDKFIARSISVHELWNMAVNFYGLDNLNVLDRGLNKTLLQIATERKDIEAITALTSYSEVEARAVQLFDAVLQQDLLKISKLNKANYRDKNGYTALVKAIVNDRYEAMEHLVDLRPDLKSIPDNANRYPLHYAYALPADIGEKYIRKLLEKNPSEIEGLVDKDGRRAAEYANICSTEEIQTLLMEARTRDCQGHQQQRS